MLCSADDTWGFCGVLPLRGVEGDAWGDGVPASIAAGAHDWSTANLDDDARRDGVCCGERARSSEGRADWPD